MAIVSLAPNVVNLDRDFVRSIPLAAHHGWYFVELSQPTVPTRMTLESQTRLMPTLKFMCTAWCAWQKQSMLLTDLVGIWSAVSDEINPLSNGDA